MATQRFLGGSWATVHAPADLRSLALWVLDAGFAGVGVGPGPRALPWSRLAGVLGDLPFEVAGSRAGGILEAPSARAGSLASTKASERGLALQRVQDAVGIAHALGSPRVVMDPGAVVVSGDEPPGDLGDPTIGWTEDMAATQLARRNAVLDVSLDVFCRTMFEVCRANPEIEFALTPSRHVLGLGDPEGLSAVLEDLSSYRVSYWHDPALAARRADLFGTAQGEWLESFGNRMSGMVLADCVGGDLYLPPGAGGVDYPLLTSYRRRLGGAMPAVVELDPAVEPGEIPGVHAFLTKYGL